MYCDDHTIASIVTAVSLDAGVAVPEPPYAVYKEVERVVKKAMSRRVRKAVAPLCERVLSSGQDPLAWAEAAKRSIDRMAVIASGSAASVIDQIVGMPGSPARSAIEQNIRAKSVLIFALSDEYLQLRSQLGMGVA